MSISANSPTFQDRHIGIASPADRQTMLDALGYDSLDALVDTAVPADIRSTAGLDLPPARSEEQILADLRTLADKNVLKTQLIGQGFYDTHTPPVIRRNVLENPAWYTAYTPYQPEISQGRLEALLNFQTMVSELTALPIANASMLDESSAAAEAVLLMRRANKSVADAKTVLDANLFPQTIAVIKGRAAALGFEVEVVDLLRGLPEGEISGIVLQQPGDDGAVQDHGATIAEAKARGAMVTVIADLLALTLIVPPGEQGADVAVGNTQRFGVPLFFGGPHAAYLAVRNGLERSLPARLVGVSKDRSGRTAYRLALQTREQHIRREKATSNICTAQALLAITASMYAVYHGPEGLKGIAERTHAHARRFADALRGAGIELVRDRFFDTIQARVPGRAVRVVADAAEAGFNLRLVDADTVGVSFDETTTDETVAAVAGVFGAGLADPQSILRSPSQSANVSNPPSGESNPSSSASVNPSSSTSVNPSPSAPVSQPSSAPVSQPSSAAVNQPSSAAVNTSSCAESQDLIPQGRDSATDAQNDGRAGVQSGGKAGAQQDGKGGTRADGMAALVSTSSCAESRDLAHGRARYAFPASLTRTSDYLTHPIFHTVRSETQMMRYLRRLADRDLALDRTMIPLGSCTMKLNSTAEMESISWPEFAGIHPYAPAEQTAGWRELIANLERWLTELTGYAGISLQPNAGSQGEYAGLLAIRDFHRANGEPQRDVCLIPASAHGTNAASAVLAGMRVVVVRNTEGGHIDMADLDTKIEANREQLAAIMITYPSTYGVYDTDVREVCDRVHAAGGQVYIDGANMNALVGLAKPGEFGGDVSHLNLHKTFAIPHGGGGPGVGPVAAAAHLVPYLPGDPIADVSVQAGVSSEGGITVAGGVPVAATIFGSAGVLPISYAYIAMMGAEGLTNASRSAILSANYIAAKLRECFPVLFTAESGLVAHESILDLRELTAASGVTAEDVAKRLIDFGFHAPTLAFPVAGTLMVEPTESEDIGEIDRFIEAMIAIRAEIDQIVAGDFSLDDSPLRNAPHDAVTLLDDSWARPYSREQAAFPVPRLRVDKYFPPVSRIDGAFGDRNLVCACPPVGDFE